MMVELIELAERCEKALGWGLELDHDIYMSADAEHGSFDKRYTGSLDAAMTLAKGLGGQVTFFKDGTAKVFLWQPYPLAVEAKASSPALALCAAALRARALSDARDGQGEG